MKDSPDPTTEPAGGNGDPTDPVASSGLAELCAGIEEKVGSAIVPGELPSWCREVAACLGDLRQDRTEVFEHHQAELGGIAGEDPELQTRVDIMRDKLDAARSTLDGLEERVEELCLEAEPSSETSEEPTRAGEELRLDLLSWVVQARAIDGEILTWSQEAVNRDRGISD